MSSPNLPHIGGPGARRQPSFLLLQEDDFYPLVPKGQGALASLIRNRPATALPQLNGPAGWWTSDEEAAVAGSGEYGAVPPRDDEDAELRRLDERRMSAILNGPQMRSMRLIGNNNPRYRWERYWKTDEQLKAMTKSLRCYYERTNYLIQQYLYIDRLLDSSLPHDLLNEYHHMTTSGSRSIEVPDTISEETISTSPGTLTSATANGSSTAISQGGRKIKRTPKDIYRPSETTPLFAHRESLDDDDEDTLRPDIPWADDEGVDSGARIVTVAIYANFAANAILLLGKIIVVASVPSVSMLASLVDAALDFLSTAIVWTTTWLISQQDQYKYPVGRRRLEPLGVLVFSVVMITSFVQVALEAIQRLVGDDHSVIELGIPALAILFSTVVIKSLVWLWCRAVRNSSVQALASDASTDIIFNTGSIAFPIVGFYAGIWWLDALGGLLLSLVVIFNWCQTSAEHIKRLSGFSATADQRNILLYLTMRFAKTIKGIQGLQAYHAGDKLNVEVDIVLDEHTALKDSHDLSESLQYVLESVPIVDRAFVHVDYASYNLPTHMEQQAV